MTRIAQAANLTTEDLIHLRAVQQGRTTLNDSVYTKLYEYYLSSGEMPYGTAKARTGDPYDWIGERLPEVTGVSADFFDFDDRR